jgi:hypothetical protein
MFHHAGPKIMESSLNNGSNGIWNGSWSTGLKSNLHYPAFTGADGVLRYPWAPRFALIDSAIGLARMRKIYS